MIEACNDDQRHCQSKFATFLGLSSVGGVRGAIRSGASGRDAGLLARLAIRAGGGRVTDVGLAHLSVCQAVLKWLGSRGAAPVERRATLTCPGPVAIEGPAETKGSHTMSDSRSTPPLSTPRPALELFSEADVPTPRGVLRTVVFLDKATGREHVALVKGEVSDQEGVPVRVHSECLTSEVFGSLKCDCRQQLDLALDFIAQQPRGVLLYLRQEGRGIGLGNKIKAYALQAQGLDTYEANRQLGFPDDLRSYDIAAEMLRMLGVRTVDLITNNPLKIIGLENEGIPVRRRIPSRTEHNPHNVGYLKTKRERTGHLIELFSEDEKAKAAS